MRLNGTSTALVHLAVTACRHELRVVQLQEPWRAASAPTSHTTQGASLRTGRACTGRACTGRACTGLACTGRACTGRACTGLACTGRACTGLACTGRPQGASLSDSQRTRAGCAPARTEGAVVEGDAGEREVVGVEHAVAEPEALPLGHQQRAPLRHPAKQPREHVDVCAGHRTRVGQQPGRRVQQQPATERGVAGSRPTRAHDLQAPEAQEARRQSEQLAPALTASSRATVECAEG
jgi:hypothetical protein